MGLVEAKQITQRQLSALAKKWQRRLRLLDWKVKVRLCGKAEFDENGKVYGHEAENCCGFCEHLTEARQATIWLLKPGEVQEEDERTANLYNTLVHELLHLHFAPFADKRPEDSLLFEQAIEAITEALLKDE